MMVYEIRKVFKFEAAHRLVRSWSKQCQNIHGHSYKVEIALRSEELNEDGMVIDFGFLKELVREKIEQFDHRIVLTYFDPGYVQGMEDNKQDAEEFGVVWVDFNPTAENMAKYFYDLLWSTIYANEDLRHLSIGFVRVHETETGYAEYKEIKGE